MWQIAVTTAGSSRKNNRSRPPERVLRVFFTEQKKRGLAGRKQKNGNGADKASLPFREKSGEAENAGERFTFRS